MKNQANALKLGTSTRKPTKRHSVSQTAPHSCGGSSITLAMALPKQIERYLE